MKKNWEEEEEKLKKPRKKAEKRKMKVSGKSVFNIQKQLKKKK